MVQPSRYNWCQKWDDDQEVPVEDAEVRSVAEPRERRGDGRNLAAVRSQKKKDRVLDARCRGKEQRRAQRKKWAPEEFGRSPQRDDLSCRRGTTKNLVHEDDPE
jgi:hypothetical protein